MIRTISRLAVGLWILSASSAVIRAALDAEKLLPNTTRGVIIVANLATLEEHFNQSELGKLANDPAMKPFVDDFHAQIHKNGARRMEKLGLTWDELEGVPGGEVAFAVSYTPAVRDPKNPIPASAAQIILVDVTGKKEKAEALLGKISTNLKKQGARLTSMPRDPITVYALAHQEGEQRPRVSAYFLDGTTLAAADDLNVLRDIYSALKTKPRTDSLATLPAYRNVMDRSAKELGEVKADFRWYLDPFGLLDARRLEEPPALRRVSPDKALILRRQGFSAIQGMGGLVNFKTDRYELLHRTAIYAPRDPLAEAKEKYRLAARMLAFENGGDLTPEPWMPRDLASYTSFHCDVLKSFDSSETLVDAMAGGEKGVFKDVVSGLRDDPKGPMVDLREEIVAKLGRRCTVVSDYMLPIDTKSERKAIIVDIPAQNVNGVTGAIRRLFEKDSDVTIHAFNGIKIYEIVEPGSTVQASSAGLTVPAIKIGGPNMTPVMHADLKREKNKDEDSGRLLKNAAICVAHDHLFIASHVDFLKKMLVDQPSGRQLAEATDLRLVNDELTALGAKDASFRIFSRTDESYRPTYELIRQGKMPESETMLGAMLNTMFSEGKEGVLRPQRVDGRNLPDYEVARRYFGMAGHFVRTEDDGWFITGFTLSKDLKR